VFQLVDTTANNVISIEVDGKPLEQVTSFVYFGTATTSDAECKEYLVCALPTWQG